MKANRHYPQKIDWLPKLFFAALILVSTTLIARHVLAQSVTELPARYETVVENWSSQMDWSDGETQQVVSAIGSVDNLNQAGSDWYVAKALYENLDSSLRDELIDAYDFPMALMRGVSNRPANAGPANRRSMRGGGTQRPGMQAIFQFNLTPAQRQQMRSIQMEFRAKQADLRQNENLTYEEFRGKMISLGNEKAERFKEVLNEEQFEEWQEMRSQRMTAQNSSRLARREALSLDSKTENALFQIRSDMRAQMRSNRGQMAQGGRRGGAVNRTQRFQMMQDQVQELAGLLSDKQEDIAIIKFALNNGWSNPAMMGRGANRMRRPGAGMRQQRPGSGMMQGSRGMRGGGMRGPGNCMYYNSY